jgi:hypothetical protein
MRAISAAILSGVVALLMVLTATPASASTFYGDYLNGANGYGGTFSFIECGSTCIENNAVTTRDRADGYHVHVRFQLQVNGVYTDYVNKVVYDGYQAKWKVYPYPGARPARFIMCPLNMNYVRVGTCTYHYGYKSAA